MGSRIPQTQSQKVREPNLAIPLGSSLNYPKSVRTPETTSPAYPAALLPIIQ